MSLAEELEDAILEKDIQRVQELLEKEEPDPELVENIVYSFGDVETILAFENYIDGDGLMELLETDFYVVEDKNGQKRTIRRGRRGRSKRRKRDWKEVTRELYPMFVRLGVKHNLLEEVLKSKSYYVYDAVLPQGLLGKIEYPEQVLPVLNDLISSNQLRLDHHFSEERAPPDEFLSLVEEYPTYFSFDVIETMLFIARKVTQRMSDLAVSIEGFYEQQQLSPNILMKVTKKAVLGVQPDLYPEAWVAFKKVLDEYEEEEILEELSPDWYAFASELAQLAEPADRDQIMALLIMAGPDQKRLANRYFQEVYLNESMTTSSPDLPLYQEYSRLKYLLSLIRK